MLSFLYNASNLVEQMLPALGLRHPWVTSPKNAAYYFMVYLTKQGTIKTCVSLDREEARGKRHFKKSNQISAPLFSLEQAVNSEDKEAFLRRHIFTPMRVLSELASDHIASKELWRRIKPHQSKPLEFLDMIVAAVMKTGKITEEEINSQETKPKTVVVFLENSEDDTYFFSASSYKDLVRILRERSLPSQVKATTCDIFGDKGTIVNSPLPKIKAGSLMQFSPYERNKDTGAYSRYGLNSVNACPLTEASLSRIYDALMALTLPEFRNKIWSYTRYPIGKKANVDQQTIIVPDFGSSGTYNKAVEKINPLAILDNLDDDLEHENEPELSQQDQLRIFVAEGAVLRYKRLAEPIIAALSGMAKGCLEAQYHLLVIQKFGKGAPVKSVHRTILFDALSKRMQFWVDAVGTPPNRTFGYFVDGKRVVTSGNEAIRPFELPGILNRCWKQNAGVKPDGKFIDAYEKQISHNSFSVSTALDLFLSQDRSIAQAMLSQIARHHIWLMYDVVHRDRHFRSVLVPSRKPGWSHCRRDVLKLLGLISILYRVQENIMSEDQVKEAVGKAKEREATAHDAMAMETPYRMGKVLAIADIMHRKKFKNHTEFPETFVGELFFPLIARGSQIKEYWSRFPIRVSHIVKWARIRAFKVMDQQKNDLPVDPQEEAIAKVYFWFKKEMGKIAGINIPDQFTPSDKCLFVSGYYSVR